MAKALSFLVYYTLLKPDVINRSLDVALAFNLVKVRKNQLIDFKIVNVFSTCWFTCICELKM